MLSSSQLFQKILSPGFFLTGLLLFVAAAENTPGAGVNNGEHLTLHNKLANYLQQLQQNDYYIAVDADGQTVQNGTWSDYWELVADSRKRLLATEIAESLQLGDDTRLDENELNNIISYPGVQAQANEVNQFNENTFKGMPGGASRWMTPSTMPMKSSSNGEQTEIIIARFESAAPENGSLNSDLWRFVYTVDLAENNCPVLEATLHLTIRGVESNSYTSGDDDFAINARRRRAHKRRRGNRNRSPSSYAVEIGTQFYNIYDAPITSETYNLEVSVTDLVRLWSSSRRQWHSGRKIVFTTPFMTGSTVPVAIVERNAAVTKVGPYLKLKYSSNNCRRSQNGARPRRGVPTLPTEETRGMWSTNGAASFMSNDGQNKAALSNPDCTAQVNKVAGHTMCCRKEITIDFHALGHKSVLTPRILKGHVCVGRCLMPFMRGSTQGDFKEALAKASGEEPCCVPVARTGSIRFLLYDKTGQVFTRDLNNFYLQDCECRI